MKTLAALKRGYISKEPAQLLFQRQEKIKFDQIYNFVLIGITAMIRLPRGLMVKWVLNSL